MTATQTVNPRAERSTVRSAGRTFPDGTILELVRTADRELRFLVSAGDSTQIVSDFVHKTDRYVPLRLDQDAVRSVRFAMHAQSYGSTRDLFESVFKLILRLTAVRDEVVRPLAFFVIGTWLADFLPFAPYIWISAPPTTSSAPLAQVLSLLCRRVVVIGDLTPATFKALPIDLKPTLLADVFQPTRRVLGLLRASNRNGAIFASGGQTVDTYCPKVVFAPEPPPDAASTGFPLELTLSPPTKYVPILSSLEADRIAEEYQAKLLQYRLSNWPKVQAPAFAMSDLTAPLQNIAYSLGAPIVGDDKLQAELRVALKPIDEEIRVGLASLLQAIVLEALLARCHTESGQEFAVMDLTADVNTILAGRGEARVVSAEAVGWKLRGLCLRTEPVQGGRKGLVLTQEMQKKIHDLSLAYQVRSILTPPANINCDDCVRIGRVRPRADKEEEEVNSRA